MTQENESDKTLREKLEAALRTVEELTGKVTEQDKTIGSLTGTNLLMEANLGHLNPTQRQAVLTMHNGETITKESLLTTAKSLGYEPKSTTSTTQPTPTPTPDPESQPDPSDLPQNVDFATRTALAEMANGGPVDPAAAIEALQRIQAAAAGASLQPGETFEDRIKSTKSPAELDHLLSTQGPANGMILGSDLD